MNYILTILASAAVMLSGGGKQQKPQELRLWYDRPAGLVRIPRHEVVANPCRLIRRRT